MEWKKNLQCFFVLLVMMMYVLVWRLLNMVEQHARFIGSLKCRTFILAMSCSCPLNRLLVMQLEKEEKLMSSCVND